jgi:hypothetical protein
MTARPPAPARQGPARQGPARPGPKRPASRPAYRLLHSSGDRLIHDRATALRHLARLPGARLFVLEASAAAVR